MPCSHSVTFDPTKDIPDLSGRVIFVTGGTAGLGKESVIAFAKHNPAHIYFTGRNATSATSLLDTLKASNTTSAVQVTFLECDMASLSSVASAVRQFLETSDRLDILMCNAGVMATPAGLTQDGYENQFGVNHLAHALFIKLLLPTLVRTASQPNSDVRIISLTSTGYRGHPSGGIQFDSVKTTQDAVGGSWVRYGQSKLANILYASELSRRYPEIISVSVHPGVVGTGLVNDLSFMKKLLVQVTNPLGVMDPDKGAYNQLWCATVARDQLENGKFYGPVGVKYTMTRESANEELAGKLWEWSNKELEKWEV